MTFGAGLIPRVVIESRSGCSLSDAVSIEHRGSELSKVCLVGPLVVSEGKVREVEEWKRRMERR